MIFRVITKFVPVFALLAIWAWVLAANVNLRTDMAFFAPRSPTPAFELLIANLRDGPASGLILMALSGAPPEDLVLASDKFADILENSGQFRFVANGRFRAPPKMLEALFRHRYLVDPAIASSDFSVDALRRDLKDGLRSLGTVSGMATANIFPADPTNRMSEIARHWKGGDGANRRNGVWFSAADDRAFLVAHTNASGLDLAAQKMVQDVIGASMEEVGKGSSIQLETSGPAVFAIEASQRIRKELQVLTILSAALVGSLILLAFRSLTTLLVVALPLATGILAAATVVQIVFGEIHGISLTFGITLIGVAVDYPVHLACHMSANMRPAAAINRIWPTLRLGVLTTVAGFMPIAISSFPGLAQMGWFAIVGLITAAATTRWVVPALHPYVRDPADTVWAAAWLGSLDRLSVLRPYILAVIAVAAAYFVLGSKVLFDDDLSKLSPVPQAAKLLDRELRVAAAAPDVRYLVVIEGETPENVLQRSEDLQGDLEGLIEKGVISGYDTASRYLPSVRKQKSRQLALPEPDRLRRILEEALTGLPFRKGAFSPFMRDVEAARTGPPITYEVIRASGLGWLIEPLLSRQGTRWIGVIAPTGLADPVQLAELVAEQRDPRIWFLDLKHETDELTRSYREEALGLLGWGALALLLVLAVGLKSVNGLLRVAAPVGVSVLATVGLLMSLGGGLSLFNLLSLLLVTGVGLDYALFFNRYSSNLLDRAKSLRAILICSATTVCVFAVLAFSEMPALSGIGLTVTLGTLLSVMLTPVFATKKFEIQV